MPARYLLLSLPLALYLAPAAGAALPDPTRPPDYAVGMPPPAKVTDTVTSFTVTAIRIDRNDRSAIVNGQLVRVGDHVGQARVLEIHTAYVVMYHDRRREDVRLYDDLVKVGRDHVDSVN